MNNIPIPMNSQDKETNELVKFHLKAQKYGFIIGIVIFVVMILGAFIFMFVVKNRSKQSSSYSSEAI
jgi:uncharacterized integral membrane protein